MKHTYISFYYFHIHTNQFLMSTKYGKFFRLPSLTGQNIICCCFT